MANLAGLSLSEWVRAKCNDAAGIFFEGQPRNGAKHEDGHTQDLLRAPGVRLDRRRPSVRRGPGRRSARRNRGTLGAIENATHAIARRSGANANLAAVDASGVGDPEPVPLPAIKPKQPDSVSAMVAGRTGHTEGCECMQCVQTQRFIEQQRKASQPKKEKARR